MRHTYEFENDPYQGKRKVILFSHLQANSGVGSGY